MFTFTQALGLLFALSLSLMAWSPTRTVSRVTTTPIMIETAELPATQNSTFYTIRPDMRKCASPMCGGYFVKRVNATTTRCANGRNMSECYVASIDWNGIGEVDARRALLKGELVNKGNTNGKYGVLKVTEAWQAVATANPSGDFYRVRDLGVRCIAAPCETHSEAKLNSTMSRKIAGINLKFDEPSAPEMEEVNRATTSQDGVLVAGTHETVTGPAGRSQKLNVTQLYLHKEGSTALKPCVKTGCSNEICADEQRMSTCEYRPEYECYKKAACERQEDGNCGFTQTTELKSCIASKRKASR